MANNLSVLDMVKGYGDSNNGELMDLFNNNPVQTAQKAAKEAAASAITEQPTPKKKEWTPDEDLLDGMPELQTGPVTYSQDELRLDDDGTLKNIADDNAIENSREAMDELSRITANIEDAKKRHGITKLQIPQGQYYASFTAAAGDTNYKRAQAALDELLDEVEKIHPDFILEWAEGKEPKRSEAEKITAPVSEETPEVQEDEGADITEPTEADTKVIINKTDLPNVSWSEEEMEKIRRSRTVELNIKEVKDLNFSQIEDVPTNAIDAVLQPFMKKVNDIDSPLPASKYRGTFTGLSYPQVIDLSNSQELNTIEGEMKKWSIAFEHMKNQSIGEWREYQWYIDPKTKQRIEISISAPVPAGIDGNDVHVVTKFEDFLMKTSFMDLEWMIWKILCATTKENEIISIDCHALYKGAPCKKTYDWVYCPKDLLMVDQVNPSVLEDMEKTSDVASKEDIISNYNSSLLQTENVVEMNSSGFMVVFGHISAYEYLTNVYPKIKNLEDAGDNDPTYASRSINYSALTVVKAFLVPEMDNNGNKTGRYFRVTGVDNLLRIIEDLDEVDWQTLTELVRMMLEPYQFQFALRDIVCPRCGNRSSIPIDSMTRLLFLVARSLSSVRVILKQT